ncbi:MAG: FAD-dependent oxidoreductase [Bacteroidetes bacterium]|nr:FAD-dependent oxidoreductase [Bacteroidota bacterium]
MHFDVLVIGQGLAGTVLSLMLESDGKSVLVADTPELNHCSTVAAGLLNPITGKRQTLAWKASEFFPFASEFYKAAEGLLEHRFFYPMPVKRVLSSVGELNTWSSRVEEQPFSDFISTPAFCKNPEGIVSTNGCLSIESGGWVDFPEFILRTREHFSSKKAFINLKINWTDITQTQDGFGFGENTFSKIIFSNGWPADPIWNFLPFTPMKGEIITIETEYDFSDILVGSCFVLPVCTNTIKAGATYDWRNINTEITPAAREELLNKTDSFIAGNKTVVNQQAGIRPSVRDRRPLLGEHPEIDHLYLFNGLGSKGSSTAPLLAKWLIDFIYHDQSLIPEVDLKRFK